jgi:uncharacterized protein YdaU (DUF1376 family)
VSFAFLPLYTGDYLRDTRHLSPLKHGIYVLLLMHCWDQRGPVPIDEQEAAGVANCRSQDEIEALRYVLSRFFTRMDDGFYNHRMQKEIERSQSISHARSEAGRRGYEARAKQLPSKSQAIAKQVHLPPPPPPSPPPSPQPRERQRHASPTAPRDVDAQVWVDWTALRKAKRAAVTATAIAGIRKEAAKVGMSLEDAMRMSCERGWAGFKAEWVSAQATAVDKYAAQAARVAKLLDGEVFDAK